MYRSEQWLCSRFVTIRVAWVFIGAGFGGGHFDLGRLSNIKQVLQPSRHLGSPFVGTLLGRATKVCSY